MKDPGKIFLQLCFGISGDQKYPDYLHNCGSMNLQFYTDLYKLNCGKFILK